MIARLCSWLMAAHKVTCPRNPQCYLGFGEKKEGIWAAANELGHDPADDLRSEDVPVGLKVRSLLRPRSG